MRHSIPFIVALALAVGGLLPSGAGAARAGVQSGTSERVTFRLQVAGQQPRDATFWVAYGPIAGRFGVIQLRAGDHGIYTAAATFPAGRSTILAYLVGRGVLHTRYGREPGPPVTTIWRSSYAPLDQLVRHTARWSGPVG